MMRPMCGSSSATSTWQLSFTRVSSASSHQRRDLLPVATQFVHELADVRVRLRQNDEHGFRRQYGYDDDALTVFEDGGDQFATPDGRAKLVRRTDDGWDSRRQIFRIEARYHLAVDQQTVSTEYDGCIHSLALAQCRYQIANARHACSVG